MKRYLIPIIIILVLTSGLWIGCASNLPEEINEQLFVMGNDVGYGWGYSLVAENEDRRDLFWTPPDKVDDAQKFNPKVNIRDFYIPKGYWTMNDVADSHYPDGTPFNDKQKKQAMEAYNWGFYSGFMQGCDDYREGKPDRSIP